MAVGRFQIMAMLQAARALELGLPPDSADSWGLNRAIFIAAAKRGFKGRRGDGGMGGSGKPAARNDVFNLGDDMAYKTEKDGVTLFTIGGEVQTPEAFDRQVKSRFGRSWPKAWKQARDYVKGFDKDILLSGNSFFSEVYRPVRDEWAESWSVEAKNPEKPAKASRSRKRS
jgi:hypothetical protein